MPAEQRREVGEIKEAKDVEEKTGGSGPVRTFRDLLVYKQAYRLALEISTLSRERFPARNSMSSGSSRSVAANIVEGWTKRSSVAEFKRHLVIASGEAAETKFWLDLAADEGLAKRESCRRLEGEYSKLGMMLHNLWKEWRKL